MSLKKQIRQIKATEKVFMIVTGKEEYFYLHFDSKNQTSIPVWTTHNKAENYTKSNDYFKESFQIVEKSRKEVLALAQENSFCNINFNLKTRDLSSQGSFIKLSFINQMDTILSVASA